MRVWSRRVLFVAVLAGCGGDAATEGGADAGGAPDAARDADALPELGCGSPEAQALPVEALAPRATDPDVRPGDPPHRLVRAAGTPSGRLLVFFPGATADPAEYEDLLRHAAAGGDDALALAYANDVRIFAVCARDDDPGCQENLRLEILRGEGVRVTRPDRDELWAIRDGAWSYETLLAHAEAAAASPALRTQRKTRELLLEATRVGPWSPAAWRAAEWLVGGMPERVTAPADAD